MTDFPANGANGTPFSRSRSNSLKDKGAAKVAVNDSSNTEDDTFKAEKRAEKKRTGLMGLLAKIPVGAYTFFVCEFVWFPVWTAIFMHAEGWEAWHSFVFVGTCISTIGSGNIAPVTPAGRLLTVFCGLGGIPLVFGAIAWVGEVSLFLMEPVLKLVCKLFLKGTPVTNKMRLIACLQLMIGFFIHAVIVYCIAEGWSVIDGIYYVFTSFSTIGFGDLEPWASMSVNASAGRPFTFYHVWHTGTVTYGLVLLSMCFRVIIAGLQLSESKSIGDSDLGKAAAKATAAGEALVRDVTRRASEKRRRSSNDESAIKEAILRHQGNLGGLEHLSA